MSAPLQRLIVHVESSNDKGVKADGVWHNFSRYAKPEALAPVQAGQWAELQVDGSGFVRAVIGQAKPTAETDEPPFPDALEDAQPTVTSGLSKDQIIVRQTCLKVASEFTSLRTDLKSCDLIKLAECLERWVWR